MLQSFLKNLGSKGSKAAAVAALPGTGLNFAIGTLTGGPVAGAAYAAGDFLLNYPLIRAARRVFPGNPATLTYKTKAGEQIIKDIVQPSVVENVANIVGSFASAPLVDYATQGALLGQNQIEPKNISQEQQIYQQSLQRQQVNNLQQQALAPGTQFQMQGIEQTFHYPGMTLPPEVLRRLQEEGGGQ